MFKRIFLFLAMNLAIIVLVTIVIAIIEAVFGVSISAYGGGYTSLFIFALIFGFVGSFISLFLSKWMAKRAYKIKVIKKEEAFNLAGKEKLVWDLISDLSERNRIQMPEVGIYEDSEPNAFATGATKNKSLVAVSSGLLDNMNEREIEGVIAHEMSHILNGDMVTMTLLQGVLNTFVIFFARIAANIVEGVFSKGEDRGGGFIYYMVVIFFEIVFGVLASMIAMAFSRYREFQADRGSANFVGKEKMIEALQALKKLEPVLVHTTDSQDQKFAAFKIESKRGKGITRFFASHPSLDDRIKALENMVIR